MPPTSEHKQVDVEIEGDHAYIRLQPKSVAVDYQARLAREVIDIRVDYDWDGRIIGFDIHGFR